MCSYMKHNIALYQISGQICLCVCGSRTENVCGTCACVWNLRVLTYMCARNDLSTCKNEMLRKMVQYMFITLLPSYVASVQSYVTNVFIYNLYIAVYSYVVLSTKKRNILFLQRINERTGEPCKRGVCFLPLSTTQPMHIRSNAVIC